MEVSVRLRRPSGAAVARLRSAGAAPPQFPAGARLRAPRWLARAAGAALSHGYPSLCPYVLSVLSRLALAPLRARRARARAARAIAAQLRTSDSARPRASCGGGL